MAVIPQNDANPQSAAPTVRLPDREMMLQFVDAVFRHCDPTGWVSFRVFPSNGGPVHIQAVRLGDPEFAELMLIPAEQAADWIGGATFAPPIATFLTHKDAKTESLCQAPVISVELDARPYAARVQLEELLGPATAVIASGGVWTNPETGEIEDKLHVYWRLAKPAATDDKKAMLYAARSLATTLVGADRTNISLVHPLRWPGSWHCKAAPRLAQFAAISSDIEIELEAALDLLRSATGITEPLYRPQGAFNGGQQSPVNASAVASALAVIPNDSTLKDKWGNPVHGWEYWNWVGMATWASTGGSAEGGQAFQAWSAKSGFYDEKTTTARWKHYEKSPPTKFGFGALVRLAKEADPSWHEPVDEATVAALKKLFEMQKTDTVAAAFNGMFGKSPERLPFTRGAVKLTDFVAFLPAHKYIYKPNGELWLVDGVNGNLGMVKVGEKKVKIKKPKPKEGVPAEADEYEKKDITMPAATWLDRNRPIAQTCWAPGHPQLIEHKLMCEGGWIDQPGVTMFNFYRPPVRVPGNKDNAGPWLDLVKRLYPGDVDHIVGFFAHRVQRPEEKINHSLVLTGSPGIGKDTLIAPLKEGVGPWNFKEIAAGDVMNAHNDFMKSVVLRISETHDLGDTDRFKFYEKTKTMFAAPPNTTRINTKYVPQYEAMNVTGAICTTNYPNDGLYLPADDRRHYVCGTEVTSEDPENEKLPELWDWYKAGGINDVVAYLEAYDLSKSSFDAKAPPPKTEAFYRMADAGRATEDPEFMDAIDELGTNKETGEVTPRKAITLEELRWTNAACSELREWFRDKANRRKVSHRLDACGYIPVRHRTANGGLWKLHGQRQVVYAMKSLSPDDRYKAAEALKAAADARDADAKAKGEATAKDVNEKLEEMAKGLRRH